MKGKKDTDQKETEQENRKTDVESRDSSEGNSKCLQSGQELVHSQNRHVTEKKNTSWKSLQDE